MMVVSDKEKCLSAKFDQLITTFLGKCLNSLWKLINVKQPMNIEKRFYVVKKTWESSAKMSYSLSTNNHVKCNLDQLPHGYPVTMVT